MSTPDPFADAVQAGEIASTCWMVNHGQLSSEAAALMVKAIRKQFSAFGPIDSIIQAAIIAAEPIITAAAREQAAKAIETHAESIGWYEGGGVWAEAIDIARDGTP